MSRRYGAWQTLGIDAADSDARAVKRAYAQRLKAIDVDADPGAFIALRGAMEQALAELRWREQAAQAPSIEDEDEEYESEAEEDDQPDRWSVGWSGNTEAERPATIAAVESGADAPADTTPNPLDSLNAEIEILAGLLFGEEDTGSIGWKIELCWREITTNPVLDKIDVLADVEQWFAGAIAQSLPRSDPLVWPAIKFFGWAGDEQRWNGDGRVAAILRRQRDLYFLHQLAQPDNLLNYAFLLLQQSPDEVPPKDFARMQNGVRMLLRSIRYQFPTAEWNFDEARVQAWIDRLEAPRPRGLKLLGSGDGHPVFDNGLVFDGQNVTGNASGHVMDATPASPSAFPLFWLGIVFLPYVACWWTLRKGYPVWARIAAFSWAAVALIFIVASDRPAGQASGNIPTITGEPGSLEYRIGERLAATERANPGFEAIKDRNPELYAQLRAAAHEREMDHIDDKAMSKRVDDAINGAYARMLPDANDTLLIEHFRLRQMRLAELQRLDPAACADENRQFDTALLSDSYRQRVRQLIVQTVTQAGSSAVPSKSIDMAAMMGKAARSLGIPLDQFAQRLSSGQDPPSACAAKIALLDAIATEPESGIAVFFRKMLKDNAAKAGS